MVRKTDRPDPPRILLAEHDAAFRSLLATALAADGYEVIEALDGTELIHCLAGALAQPGRAVDVVVTDTRMAGPLALAVLLGIRGSPAAPPVIVVTAFPDEKLDVDTRLGAVAVLDKPFDVDDLRTTIRLTLEQHLALRWPPAVPS